MCAGRTACGCWPTPRRASARAIAAARSARIGHRDRDQLLPGQAARLLRRRRRGLHRRRRARRDHALAARARPGRRQVRQRAHRHERPAGHLQAAILIEKLGDLRRRDRGAQRRRRALRRGARRRRGRAAPCRRRDVGLGAVHDPGRPGGRRDALADALQGARASRPRSTIRKPLHRQTGLPPLSRSPATACRSPSALAAEVISLPMHPYLAPDVQDRDRGRGAP